MNNKKIISIICVIAMLFSVVFTVPFSAIADSSNVQIEKFDDTSAIYSSQASKVKVVDGALTGTNTKSATVLPVRFNNITLKANTDYHLTFSMQINGAAETATTVAAVTNVNTYRFYADGNSNCVKNGLLGKTTDSPRKDMLPIVQDENWHEYSVTFNTGTLVDSTHTFLGFVTKGNNATDLSFAIDNLVLTEVTDSSATTGNVFRVNADGTTVLESGLSSAAAYVPPTDIGSLSSQAVWYADKECTVLYDGTVTANQTKIIYAKIEDKKTVQAEAFDSEKSVYSWNYGAVVENGAVSIDATGYAYMPVRFNNIKLAANKEYKLTFSMKISGVKTTATTMVVCNDNATWDFWCGGDESHDGFKYNLLGEDANMDGYREGTLPLQGNTWNTYNVSFNTGDKVAAGRNTLGFYTKCNGGNASFTIDDIVLTEVADSAATTGNIVTVAMDGAHNIITKVESGTAFYPDGVSAPAGKTFDRWALDKNGTVDYTGNVPANTTVLLYPIYRSVYENFEGDDTIFVAGYNATSIATDGLNKYVHSAVSTSAGQYPIMAFRLNNMVLEPNTAYNYSFSYKKSGNSLNLGLYLLAGRNVDNWQFWTDGSEKANQYNLLGTDTNASGHRTDKINLNNSDVWTTVTGTFTTANIVTTANNKLTFFMQAAENAVYDIYFDDVIITPVKNAPGGVITNDGNGNYEYIENVAANAPADPVPQDGAAFKGWFTDRSFYNVYGGSVANDTTVMLYAKYGFAPVVIDFESKLNIHHDEDYDTTVKEEANGNHYLNTSGYSGEYKIFAAELEDIILKENTKYVVTMRYKNESNAGLNHGLFIAAGRYSMGGNFYSGSYNIFERNLIGSQVNETTGYRTSELSLPLTSEWSYASTVIDTTGVANGEFKYLTLIFQGLQSKSYNVSFDDITLTQVTDAQLAEPLRNGSFEDGDLFWTNAGNSGTVVSGGHGGTYSLHVSGATYMAKVSQLMTLTPNTNYTLSFWYKGYGSGAPNWILSKGTTVSDAKYLINKGAFPLKSNAATEWTRVSANFNSGESGKVCFYLQSDAGCDFYVDDVNVSTTVSAADPEVSETATIGSETLDLTYDGHCQRVTNYICSNANNLLGSADFETEGVWTQDALLNTGRVSWVTTDKARSGTHALRYEGFDGDDTTMSVMYFPVQANTNYMLTYYMRQDEWSENCKADFRVNILDTNTGKAVSSSAYAYKAAYGWTTCDDEWHMCRLAFKTGTNTVVGIALSGGQAGGYIDDMYLFKESNKVGYIFATSDKSMKEGTVVSTSVTNIYCAANKNLIGDTLCSGTNDFWTTAPGYGNSVKLENKGDSHGTALHYVEDLRYTGYPKQIYTFKELSVDPNTEYTMHVEYFVEKSGAGTFGLISNSVFYPETFLSYTYSNLTANQWKSVDVTFNTNDYDSIYFFMNDGGGKAWLDNIRIFKTVDGKASEDAGEKLQYDTFGSATVGQLNANFSIVNNNGDKALHAVLPAYNNMVYTFSGIDLVGGNTYGVSFQKINSSTGAYYELRSGGNTVKTGWLGEDGAYEVEFEVPTGQGGKFALYLGSPYTDTYEFEIDDVVVTLQDPNDTTGIALVANGDSMDVYSGVDEFYPSAPANVPAGKTFDFAVNKVGTTLYDGYVNAGQTVVLYPVFFDAVQYDTFGGATVGEVPNTSGELSIVDHNGDKALHVSMSGYASKIYTFSDISLVSGKTYRLTFQVFNNTAGGRCVSVKSGSNTVKDRTWFAVGTNEIEFTVPEGQGGTMAFFIDSPWDITTSLDIDDVVVTLVGGATAPGNVLLFNGDDVTAEYGVTSYSMPAQPSVEGKIAKAFSDKAATQLFDGVVPANTTLNVYVGYSDALQYETFNTAASTRDGYWDETEGAMKIHYEGEYAGRGAAVASINLLPNTNYAFSFQYKKPVSGNFVDDGKQGFGISVATDRNDIFWTDHDTAMEQHIKGDVALPTTAEWKTVTGTFNTGNYVTTGKNMLALWGKSFNGTFDLYIDDVVIMEIDPNNPVGGAVVKIVNDDEVTVAYNQTNYVNDDDIAAKAGKIGSWSADKAGLTAFDGTVAQNSIKMLYGTYRDKFVYEDFTDATVSSDNGTAVETVGGNDVVAKHFDGTDWEEGHFRTNIALRPDTKYTLTYKVYTSAKNVNAYHFLAGRSTASDNWQHWFKTWTNTEANKLTTNITCEHQNEDQQTTKNYWIKDAGKWYTCTAELDTTGIVDDNYRYLSVYLQSEDKGVAADVYFDDFCLTEVEDGCTTANFILIDANGVVTTECGVASGNIKLSNLFNTSTVYGDDSFASFCTSKERTAFVANDFAAAANATYVVYAKAVAPITHICDLVKANNQKSEDLDLNGESNAGDIDIAIVYMLYN